MFYNTYQILCAQKGLSPNAVAKELSISSGSVSEWKKGRKPQNTTLKKISDYFNVPIELLIQDNSTFWDNFIFLCAENGITPNTVCSSIGLSNAVATHWKNGAIPHDSTLKKIANYFDVPYSTLISPNFQNTLNTSSKQIAKSIKSIAKTKNINIGKMLKDCELNVNTLSSMQSGNHYPRLDSFIKIADYLDVSIDFLLGRTDVIETELIGSPTVVDERANHKYLTNRLTLLSDSELALVDAFVQGLLAHRKF